MGGHRVYRREDPTTGKIKAENLAKTEDLIQELPNRVGDLRKAGVTKQMAQTWANYYKHEAARVPQNPNALARAQLMEAIAKLL